MGNLARKRRKDSSTKFQRSMVYIDLGEWLGLYPKARLLPELKDVYMDVNYPIIIAFGHGPAGGPNRDLI